MIRTRFGWGAGVIRRVVVCGCLVVCSVFSSYAPSWAAGPLASPPSGSTHSGLSLLSQAEPTATPTPSVAVLDSSQFDVLVLGLGLLIFTLATIAVLSWGGRRG